MIRQELIEDFLNNVYPNVADNTRSSIATRLNKAASYEKEIQKDIERFDRQDFVDLFNYAGWIGAYYDFGPSKKILLDYLRWLRFVGVEASNRNELEELFVRDIDGSEKISKYYFKSVQSFCDAMTTVLADESFCRERAIFALCWSGFSADEARNIKLSDLNDEEHSVCGVQMDSQLYAFVRECAYKTFFVSVRGVKTGNMSEYTFSFVESEYVLKPLVNRGGWNRKKQDTKESEGNGQVSKRTTTSFASRAVSAFNDTEEDSPYYQKEIRYKTLAQNGILCRMYDLEQQGMDVCNGWAVKRNELQDMLGLKKQLTKTNYMNLRSTYIKWKNFYYGKQGTENTKEGDSNA